MAAARQTGRGNHLARAWAFAVFVAIVMAAPLLFGAVDRFVQGVLLLFFALGLAMHPPAMPTRRRAVNVALALCFLTLLLKEFAPAVWFGSTIWRRLAVDSFNITLPWMHNPSPVRAAEALLVAGAAVIWFLWVQTLAAEPGGDGKIAWAMLAAGAAVAVVCLAGGHREGDLIYGIRSTPGYNGFGPFPNRNHTAAFLAMSTLIGLGCVFRAARRRRFERAAAATALLGVIVVALLETRSRGGLVAMSLGIACFGGFALWRTPGKRMAAVMAACVLIALSMVLAYGGKVIERFASTREGALAANDRWTIWADAVRVWLDAPVFGHGLSTFRQVYPFYQTFERENTVVLHPESSWLQWLDELGLLLVLTLALAGGVFVFRRIREARDAAYGFYLRAGGFAAAAALVAHSVWDVPAHRWATAAFGLAALGLACPFSGPGARMSRKVSVTVAAIAALWVLPFLTGGGPLWSSAAMTRALSRNYTPSEASLETLKALLTYFPLEADLQHTVGVRTLLETGAAGDAFQHFRAADRLKPCSWGMPMAQALVSGPYSPRAALYFWTLAIERAGNRAEEVLVTAFRHTANLPEAKSFWPGYVRNHPELLLTYARLAPPEEGGEYYRLWWQRRAKVAEPAPFEVSGFYATVARWGAKEDLLEWIRLRPQRADADHVPWARLLHEWNDDLTAWKLLAEHISDPPFPEALPARPADEMEAELWNHPDNYLLAQGLAATLDRWGDRAKRNRVVLRTAEREDAPPWFLQKAAYLHASEGRYREAVEILLRMK